LVSRSKKEFFQDCPVFGFPRRFGYARIFNAGSEMFEATMPIARRSAADANLVILSFSGIIELPARVKDWIERWARFANSQNSALVTLMDHKAKVAATAATHSYLR
jgi:hypothetical protein